MSRSNRSRGTKSNTSKNSNKTLPQEEDNNSQANPKRSLERPRVTSTWSNNEAKKKTRYPVRRQTGGNNLKIN